MKVIVVSHGSYSKGLVESVQMLIGEQDNLVAHGLFPQETVNALTDRLEEEIKKTKPGEEILFCSDLFHGSPFNAIVSLMKEYNFHHVTGINLPLAVEIMMGRYADKTAAQICEDLLKAAPDTFKYVNQMFEENDAEEDEE